MKEYCNPYFMPDLKIKGLLSGNLGKIHRKNCNDGNNCDGMPYAVLIMCRLDRDNVV